jgi:hypothetical protein
MLLQNPLDDRTPAGGVVYSLDGKQLLMRVSRIEMTFFWRLEVKTFGEFSLSNLYFFIYALNIFSQGSESQKH